MTTVTDVCGRRGLVLAAPRSGSGKTVLTLALLRALRNQGIKIASAKVGPDYIDPGFHQAASGYPSINLDPWAMRPSTLAALMQGLSADLILCEGVMGLFDGAGQAGERGSTADLAAMTGWPVVLIVDTQGQSASVGALLQGFVRHRADITVAGVIFNRVASSRHYAMLMAAAQKSVPSLRILGAIERKASLELPARHLGLVLAEEHTALADFLDEAALLMVERIDLAALIDLARPVTITAQPSGAMSVPVLGQRIAIARDLAFAFAYPHLLSAWRAAGAELSFFSPLSDEGPSPNADAIFLPGGYPELYGAILAGASRFRTGMHAAAAAGTRIYGECGGYMALGHGLVDADGHRHEMVGLLPISTSIAAPKRRLGYRSVRGLAGFFAGIPCRGHEFHFASEVMSSPPNPLWRVFDSDDRPLGDAGAVVGSVMGSFFHLIDREN